MAKLHNVIHVQGYQSGEFSYHTKLIDEFAEIIIICSIFSWYSELSLFIARSTCGGTEAELKKTSREVTVCLCV